MDCAKGTSVWFSWLDKARYVMVRGGLGRWNAAGRCWFGAFLRRETTHGTALLGGTVILIACNRQVPFSFSNVPRKLPCTLPV